MANEENLRPSEYKFTDEDRRKATKARQENLKRRKSFADVFETFLNGEYADRKGKMASGAEVLGMKVVEKALKGDLKAFELIRDTIGEKPVEKIAKVDISTEVRAEVEALANDYEQRYSSRDIGE